MSRDDEIFRAARANETGRIYASKHYNRMMVYLFLSRWGGPFAVAVFLFYCYKLGSQ